MSIKGLCFQLSVDPSSSPSPNLSQSNAAPSQSPQKQSSLRHTTSHFALTNTFVTVSTFHRKARSLPVASTFSALSSSQVSNTATTTERSSRTHQPKSPMVPQNQYSVISPLFSTKPAATSIVSPCSPAFRTTAVFSVWISGNVSVSANSNAMAEPRTSLVFGNS